MVQRIRFAYDDGVAWVFEEGRNAFTKRRRKRVNQKKEERRSSVVACANTIGVDRHTLPVGPRLTPHQ